MTPESEYVPGAAQATGGSKPTAVEKPDEPAALKERYLSLAADFDNFRRRTARETDRRAAAQKEAFISELLPVIDNLERALNAESSHDQLREGLQITLQQLQQLLRKHSIEADDALGQPFDPHRQEALAARRDPSQPDGVVLEVFQRGYRHGNQVLRPAKVIVNDRDRAEGHRHAG